MSVAIWTLSIIGDYDYYSYVNSRQYGGDIPKQGQAEMVETKKLPKAFQNGGSL